MTVKASENGNEKRRLVLMNEGRARGGAGTEGVCGVGVWGGTPIVDYRIKLNLSYFSNTHARLYVATNPKNQIR